MRKVFLEGLPVRGKTKQINWKKSIGHKVKGVYDNIEFEIEIIDYIQTTNKKNRIKLKYKDSEYEMQPSNFMLCQVSELLGIVTSDFKIEVGQTFKDEKRDITIIDRKYIIKTNDKTGFKTNWKWYKYKCNKCGFDGNKHYDLRTEIYKDEFWIEESALLNGQGCNCCIPSPQIVVEGINDIPTTAPELIKFFQGGIEEAKKYTKTSNKKIHAICPECGKIKNKKIGINDIYAKNSISCICSDGIKFPNKLMFNILKQSLGINEFQTEYNPKWCKYNFNNIIKKGVYDFYFELNNKEYIIEMDGGFHSNDNKMSGQTKDESNFMDNEKDRLANEHNIKVIRIDCDYDNVSNRLNYIKNNILNNKELNKIVNLSNINWNECNEYACSNLVKIACDYKKNNTDLTSTKIGEMMGYSRYGVRNWLKIGNKLGWCHYNTEEESDKIIQYNKDINSKPVICLSTGDIFEGTHDCERKSLEIFGIELDSSAISAVARGDRKSCGNLKFKYVCNLTPEEKKLFNII